LLGGAAAVKAMEIDMNRDQIKGTAKDVAGNVQRKVGEATGSTEQQIKGGAKQVEGKVQKGVGNAEEGLERARDDMRSEAERNNR
jgi:uncharacterized protein YjbJ (UPF0337 family)